MCGRMNVTGDPVAKWMLDRHGMPFTTETNTDLRPAQLVATVAYLDCELKQLNTTWT